MGGKGSGRTASHESRKRCVYDESVYCPIVDKIRMTDCLDCIWIPKKKRDEIIDLLDEEKENFPNCPYNDGVGCEWAEPKTKFNGKPLMSHCLYCGWCPEGQETDEVRHQLVNYILSLV